MADDERLKYQHPYKIRLKNGTECTAMLIHLNPKYHTRMQKHAVWKRLDDVPRKQKYVPVNDVVKVEVING